MRGGTGFTELGVAQDIVGANLAKDVQIPFDLERHSIAFRRAQFPDTGCPLHLLDLE